VVVVHGKHTGVVILAGVADAAEGRRIWWGEGRTGRGEEGPSEGRGPVEGRTASGEGLASEARVAARRWRRSRGRESGSVAGGWEA
jgi:hypothetical protein